MEGEQPNSEAAGVVSQKFLPFICQSGPDPESSVSGLDPRFRRDFKMANNFTFKTNIVKYPGEVGTFHMMDHYFESV